MTNRNNRLEAILYGKDIPPKTQLDAAAKYAVRNSGGGGGDVLPEVTAADNGKVLGVVEGAWAATDAPSGGESNVVRIPFTLTVNPDTGAISGATEAAIADAAAAMAAGKLLIADAMMDTGGFGKQHLCALISGVDGGAPAFKACASMLGDDGTELELYGITWTTAGVAVHGGKVAVSP